jgi:imidazoleglycerol phosphate dehydratase HisB
VLDHLLLLLADERLFSALVEAFHNLEEELHNSLEEHRLVLGQDC